ncbi:MAG: hypothetical protein QF872_09480 [Gammaproteobacteria bacterium]|nr:hypothetical protein [Gammaproteobacteria bacterium]
MSTIWIVSLQQKPLTAVVIVTLALLIISGINKPLLAILQTQQLSEITALAPLLCLPHGVRVLSTWYFGQRAIIYLFLATLVTLTLLYNQPVTWAVAAYSLITSSVAFITFGLFRLAGWNLYNQEHIQPNKLWPSLLLVGLISSVLDAIAIHIFLQEVILPEDSFHSLLFHHSNPQCLWRKGYNLTAPLSQNIICFVPS